MLFRLFPAIVMLLSLFKTQNADLTVGEVYKSDTSPRVKYMKKVTKLNAPLCAMECAKTQYCFSFSFGSKDCILWEARYTKEDSNILQKKAGYRYYHLNKKPDATELVLFKEELTFGEASKKCQTKKKGRLAVIRDQKTLDSFNSKFNDMGIWVGLSGTVEGGDGPKDTNGRAVSMDLRWADGQRFSTDQFNNFLPSDPNDSGRQCIAARRFDKKWFDTSCDDRYAFVCQYVP